MGIAGLLLAITAVGPSSIWPFLGVGLLNGVVQPSFAFVTNALPFQYCAVKGRRMLLVPVPPKFESLRRP